MGQQNSRDELVYQQVIEGNIDGIKALSAQGARLEWIDKKGKTPLIVASMDPRLYIEARTLIELGANIDGYRPGRHAGTPLHHASKRGLVDTVKLLLSHGANPFTRNDDCQTPLDVARIKGHCTVVRAIEAHVSYFSGDIREILIVPGILEPLVPQRLSRRRSKKCWAVVVPCSLPNPAKPPKLELDVYDSPQDLQPRTIISLWKCHIAEPKFHESDAMLAIVDESSGTRYKFLSAIEGNRRQITQLYSACKGFPEVTPPLLQPQGEAFPLSNEYSGNTRPVVPPGSNNQSGVTEDATNGWGDIPTSATHNDRGQPTPSRSPTSKASTSGWTDQPATDEYNGWGPIPDIGIPASTQPQHIGCQDVNLSASESAAPSAPPIPSDIIDEGPIHYPVIDSIPVNLAGATPNGNPDEGSCVICWDARVEGVCIPCGHMAGCMSCLTEISAKKGECPVCRAKIDQVIRVYTV